MTFIPVCVVQGSNGSVGTFYTTDNVIPWLSLYGGSTRLTGAHKSINKTGGQRK